MLTPQTKAPAFTLVDDTNTTRTLADFFGKPVLLYFYPKDDTPGCTKEACMIRDVYADFETAGIVVLGVSADSVESHITFKQKYKLPFILLADTAKEVIKAYEANGLLMTKRISYLIGKDGVILAAYPDVDPATHAHTILGDVKKLVA
jgi:peroxiredoxin Q/BCP